MITARLPARCLITATVYCLAATGCSVLKPISIPVEISHTSHVTQHFGSDRTNFGWNTVSAGLRWQVAGVNIQMMEGYSLEPVDHRHEVFQATARFEIPLR